MMVSDEFSALRANFPQGVPAAACPSRIVLDHVTSRWGILVLVALAGRTLRWGELRRTVEGVSEKMLARTLQTLERDGLVRRDAWAVIPPHVEYSLTALGEDLVRCLMPLMGWLADHAPAIVADQVRPDQVRPGGVGIGGVDRRSAAS